MADKTRAEKTSRGLTLDRRVDDERERLLRLLSDAGVPEVRIQLLDDVIDNTAWMAVKLDDARRTIRSGRIVTKYDNGGGQKGSHTNPAFPEYRMLWGAYMKGLQQIMAELPNQDKAAETAGETAPTVLGFILGKQGEHDRTAEPAAQSRA